MTVCTACEEKFAWDDDVVVVDDKMYHTACVTLYPTGYVAYIEDEYLGETENEDGQMAHELIDGLLDDDEGDEEEPNQDEKDEENDDAV